MSEELSVRWGWLRAMYIYNIVGAGTPGLMFMAFPGTIQSLFKFPAQSPALFGIYGSVLLAFALVSILGLRSPLKFSAILLMQVAYKLIWTAAVAIPFFVKGQFPFYIVSIVGIYATFIIGDLVAIPFRYLFSKR